MYFSYDLGHRAWQWYFKNTSLIGVYIAYETLQKTHIMDILTKIPIQEVYSKQLHIGKLAPSTTYSIPPQKYHPYIGFGGSRSPLDTALKDNGFQPPFIDAVDILLNETYNYVERYKLNHFQVPIQDRPNVTSEMDTLEYWYLENRS